MKIANSQRLSYRLMNAGDSTPLFELDQDPAVMHFINGGVPSSMEQINDVFIPVELKELNVPFELSIYARNGQRLYTTTSIDKPWEGRMKDGSTCTFGSYIWVLTLTNELGNKEVYKGTVTNVNN